MSAPGAAAAPPPSSPVPPLFDFVQVRALLKATLLRASRGRSNPGQGSRPHGLIALMVLNGVLGGVVGMVAFMGLDVFTYCVILWSVTLVIAGMTLIAESSTVLFDPAENDVIGHRPIHPRTLLLSRALGLAGLALVLGLAINLIPMFAGLATRGARPWFPLAYLATLLLLVPFSAAMVVFVYALLARHVSRRRFDTVATWAQVIVTAVLIIGYQLVPRLMEHMQGFRLDSAHPLFLAMPPAWFASLTDLMMGRNQGPRQFALAAAAVISTPVVGWIAVRYFAVGYARQVAALSETSMRAPAAASRVPGRRKRSIEDRLGFWLKDPVERGAFRLAAAYLGRDRDMRMRIYPQMAAFLVLVVIAVLDRKSSSMTGPFLILYFGGTLPAATLMTLKMTPQYAAADLFRYAPIAGTSGIFHGMRKAILLFLVLPGLAASFAALWFVLPDHDGLRLSVPALVALPTLSVLIGLTGSYLPLSVPPAGLRQSMLVAGLFLLGAVWMGMFAVVGAVADHFGWFWHVVVIEAVVLVLLHPWLLRDIRNRPLREEDH